MYLYLSILVLSIYIIYRAKVSLLYGLAISVDAAIKSREQKVAERYRQTLGMPYS